MTSRNGLISPRYSTIIEVVAFILGEAPSRQNPIISSRILSLTHWVWVISSSAIHRRGRRFVVFPRVPTGDSDRESREVTFWPIPFLTRFLPLTKQMMMCIILINVITISLELSTGEIGTQLIDATSLNSDQVVKILLPLLTIEVRQQMKTTVSQD